MEEMIIFIKLLYCSKYKVDEMAENSLKMLYSLAGNSKQQSELNKLVNKFIDSSKRLEFLNVTSQDAIYDFEDDLIPVE